jgi:hypothetical protein
MDGHFQRDGFVPLKTGRYQLRVINIIPTTWGAFGRAWEWKFEVVGGIHDGCRLDGKTKCDAIASTTSKFGRWYRAVTGRKPVIGDPIDRDELIGKTCWAMVAECWSNSGKPSNDVNLLPGGKSNEED